MSGADRDATPLSAQILAVLAGMFGACREGAATAIVGRGSATRRFQMPARAPGWLPGWLLHELNFQTPGDLAFVPATLTAHGEPIELGALCAEIPTRPEMHGREWRVSEAIARAAWERLNAFPVSAPIVIDAAWSLVAIWPLANAPLRLDTPEGRERAEALQRRLCERVGGLTEDVRVARPRASGSVGALYGMVPGSSPTRPVVRVPGSYQHDLGGGGALVTVARLTDTRVTVEEIEAALDAHQARTRRASRRTA